MSKSKRQTKPAQPHHPSPVIAWSLICFATALIAIAVFVGVNGLAFA